MASRPECSANHARLPPRFQAYAQPLVPTWTSMWESRAGGRYKGSSGRLPEPRHQDIHRPVHVLAAVAEVLVLEAVEVVDDEVAVGVAGVVAEPGEERLPDPGFVAVP